jgi:hypothetical protein
MVILLIEMICSYRGTAKRYASSEGYMRQIDRKKAGANAK